MRPVERGPKPKDYKKYNAAIGDLESRLGKYCSYCESRVPIGLAVEHKLPKKLHPELELTWTNFLLGCITCNSVKSETVKAENETLWPDRNNTMLALQYSDGGFVTVSKALDSPLEQRARCLIDMIGLDRHAAKGWRQLSSRDERWSEREKTWKFAEICRSRFERLGQSDDALGQVVLAALGYGFFSVWMTVFRDHSAVRKALVCAFPGTAPTCFNEDRDPVRRPGADI